MGRSGPPPKRSSERRRRNKESKADKLEVAGTVKPLDPDEEWHPIARQWFESLLESGQREFYEPSDWSLAYLIAESISRDLKPQVIGIHEETGEIKRATIPMKGASLSAYLKAMTALMVSEGDRRRARLELERAAPDESSEPAGVTALHEYRARAAS